MHEYSTLLNVFAPISLSLSETRRELSCGRPTHPIRLRVMLSVCLLPFAVWDAGRIECGDSPMCGVEVQNFCISCSGLTAFLTLQQKVVEILKFRVCNIAPRCRLEQQAHHRLSSHLVEVQVFVR
jgi:hypothetical protein